MKKAVKKGEGAGNSVSCRVWAEPTKPAPQRFSASTASTEGARCATFEQKYGFFGSLFCVSRCLLQRVAWNPSVRLLRASLRPGRSIVAAGTAVPAARFTPQLWGANGFGVVLTGHALSSVTLWQGRLSRAARFTPRLRVANGFGVVLTGHALSSVANGKWNDLRQGLLPYSLPST